MNDTKVLCWHFLADDGTTLGGTKPGPGGTETFDGKPELCKCGLHGSERAIDALAYACGGIVRRVEISGEIVRGDDKIAGTVRRELWRADATMTLHEFACRVAEQAIDGEREAGREPDPRSLAAIEMKLRWIRGEATDEELAAAWAAAGDAAWDAAGDAARAAAWDAAGDAAWAAARAAAGDDAEYAVRAAAWADAEYAVRDAQNTMLTEMLEELAKRCPGLAVNDPCRRDDGRSPCSAHRASAFFRACSYCLHCMYRPQTRRYFCAAASKIIRQEIIRNNGMPKWCPLVSKKGESK